MKNKKYHFCSTCMLNFGQRKLTNELKSTRFLRRKIKLSSSVDNVIIHIQNPGKVVGTDQFAI